MAILADGIVSGTISGDSTKAKIAAKVSCINGVPTGTIYGEIQTFTGSGISKFVFNSSSPYVVVTTKNPNGIYSIFQNVTLKNKTTNTTTNNCTVVLNSVSSSSTSWIGSITVICPNGKKLGVFGTFTGPLKVNNAVVCTPLL